MTHTARIHADTYECGELQGVRFVRVGCAHRLPRSAVEHCTALDAAGSDAALSRSSEPEGSPGPTAAVRFSGSPELVLPSPSGDPQPLRLWGDGFTPISSPQPGSGSLEPSPELREHSPG